MADRRRGAWRFFWRPGVGFVLANGIFAISVAASSAAWAGAFLPLGAVFGTRLEHSIRASPLYYMAGMVGVVLVVVAGALVRTRGAAHRH